MSVLVFFKSPV